MPVSHESYNQACRALWRGPIRTAHRARSHTQIEKMARACSIVAELPDLVWRKSLIEKKGGLTPAYHREAKRVVIAYLGSVLES